MDSQHVKVNIIMYQQEKLIQKFKKKINKNKNKNNT